MKGKVKEQLAGWLFVSPALVGLLFFTLGPAIACLVLAFFRWDIFQPPSYVGAANFQKLSNDPLFLQSIKVTVSYAVFAIPMGITTALGLALLVNQKLPGMTVFRTIFFLPNVVAGVAMMLVWRWMFNPDFGVINQGLELIGVIPLMELLGFGRPQWLSSRGGAIPALVLMSLAGTGGAMMIFLASLQNIPQALTEAAELDGAGPIRRFRHVTLPLLTPTVFFLMVVGVIGALQVFAEALVMTNGGPANATLFYNLYLYNNAFAYFRMGYACAMAVLLFAAVLCLTAMQFGVARKWVYYQ